MIASIDLHKLNQKEKTLVIVDAVNLLKNILIRTYLVGNSCQNRKKITNSNLRRVLDSLNLLIKATGINMIELIDDSKHYLTQSEHIQTITGGRIKAIDEEGRQQLQHVDMIFRLYLPLYSLLQQTGQLEAI